MAFIPDKQPITKGDHVKNNRAFRNGNGTFTEGHQFVYAGNSEDQRDVVFGQSVILKCTETGQTVYVDSLDWFDRA
jgi:hypothetical protein